MKLKYIDVRRFRFIALSEYPNGISLKEGDTVEVSNKESISLLKMKNGQNPMFIKVNERQARVTEE